MIAEAYAAGKDQAKLDVARADRGELGRIGSSRKPRSKAELLVRHAEYHERMARLQRDDAAPAGAVSFSLGRADGLRAAAAVDPPRLASKRAAFLRRYSSR